MSQPKFFTIILPIYNTREEWLKRALDSIEQQECKEDIEVVIINDAGSKDYKEILKNYTFDMIVIDNKENIGQGLSRQVGIDNSTGKWITFLDHDDEFNPTCFKPIKEDIIKSECIFVYSTQSLIANNYEFANKKEFVVEDSSSVLHGHFYNRDMLNKYEIRFSSKIRAHEDTYFLNCVDGHIIRDEKNFDEQKTKVASPIVSYFWYLWDNSQSHSYTANNYSYLEETIKEYLIAVWDSYKHVSTKYEYNAEFTYFKLCGTLMVLYWFEQSFKYINPTSWKKENEIYIKDFCEKVMDELNMSSPLELTNILLDLPELFISSFTGILSNVDGAFVARETIEQFYWNILDYHNESN